MTGGDLSHWTSREVGRLIVAAFAIGLAVGAFVVWPLVWWLPQVLV